MKYLFRVDASSEIGFGHFMRCLTLAIKIKNDGVRIRFVTRHLPMHLSDLLKKNGIEHFQLNSRRYESDNRLKHSKWLGVSQENDARDTCISLADEHWDWLIVDHYALDEQWENHFNQYVKNLMVIDDLADRRHSCDILLDQNYFVGMENRYDHKLPEHCKLLLGPTYALLRDEFKESRTYVAEHQGEINRILVSFGGADAGDCTTKILQTLIELNYQLGLDVVVGSQHPNIDQIESLCSLYGYNCHVDVQRISKLMLKTDLVIGACGSSSWERCCLGLPTIAFSLADNQIEIAKNLEILGGCIYMGEADSKNLVNLKDKLVQLLSRPDLVSKLSKNAYSIVDGLGAERVHREITTCSQGAL